MQPRNRRSVVDPPPGVPYMRDRSVIIYTMEAEARQGFVVVPGSAVWGTRCGPSPGRGVLAGRPEVPCAGHLFVRTATWRWFGPNPLGSVRLSVSPSCGDHDR
jgi:hypothetical protein